MRSGHLWRGVQGFMALHQRTVEADHANASRREAEMARAIIATKQASGILGNGRLANLRDAQAANLFDPNGLFLGALHKRPLFFSGDAPLLTYARTGTGKGRDFILPNLAHSRNRSLVVIDLKDGENCWASHAHRRDNLGHEIVYLNPFGLHGLPNVRINPLHTLIDIVRSGEQIDTEADEIAHILIPPSPKDQNGDWVGSGARRILALRMEYLACFDPEFCNLGGLWRFINSSQDDQNMAFAMMTSCGVDGIERRAHAIQATAADAPKQQEAYKSACIDALNVFEPNKRLERATAAHDVDLAALKHKPHTVYLMAPSDKLSAVAPWVSLIISYLIETVARERGPIATTFILDEFPQLPPSPAIKKMLHLYRGKGLQPWIFAQGRHLLEGKWSRDAVKDFEDSAAILNTSCVEDTDVMADIEKWSGNRTVLMHGMNRSGGTVESAGANLGESKRAVLQSEDIREIGDGRQIIRVAGMPYLIDCERVPFFKVDPWKDQIRDVRDLHKGIEL